MLSPRSLSMQQTLSLITYHTHSVGNPHTRTTRHPILTHGDRVIKTSHVTRQLNTWHQVIGKNELKYGANKSCPVRALPTIESSYLFYFFYYFNSTIRQLPKDTYLCLKWQLLWGVGRAELLVAVDSVVSSFKNENRLTGGPKIVGGLHLVGTLYPLSLNCFNSFLLNTITSGPGLGQRSVTWLSVWVTFDGLGPF